MLRWLARKAGSRAGVLGAGFLTLGLGGCASTWDDMTSQRFRQAPIDTLFGSEDPPMTVLREGRTGDERIRAMRRLSEPAQSGGDEATQNEVIQTLTTIATTDPHVLCRLTAIETLGRFQDPRATDSLVAAFRATEASPSFASDNLALIQSRSIALLGDKRDPKVLPMLTEVATRPIPKLEGDAVATGLSGQNVQDVRLAAVQAIGQYPAEDQRAAATLARVMKQEKSNVALRVEAHKGLVKLTGRELPLDSPEWDQVIQADLTSPAAPVPNAPPRPSVQQVGGRSLQ